MTVSTSASTTTQYGNGVNTSFQFNFPFVSASDLEVIYTNSSGVQTTLTASQYTLTPNSLAPGAIWIYGGTITYPTSGSPISSGTSLTISRVVPLTQTTSISNQGNFNPQVIEAALDTLEFQIQQIAGRGGAYRGVWATNVSYNFGDIVQDGINGAYTNNIYVCAIANTSGVWATDLAAGDWVLSINVGTIGSYLPLTGGTISGNLAVTGTVSGAGFTSLLTPYAPLASPTFTGVPAVPTATTGTNTTQSASTSFAQKTVNAFSRGFVNKFRNPQFQIANRGTSGATGQNSVTGAYYTLDGWLVGTTGAASTWSQGSGSTSYPANYTLQIAGGASVTTAIVRQRIESFIAGELAGQQVTVQFYVASSASGSVTPQLSVYYANSTDNFAATTAIITAQPLQTLPNGSVGTLLAYTFAMPVTAQKGIEVYLDFNGALAAGQTYYLELADIRVTPGVPTGLNSNPPLIETRPYPLEMAFCQRYFETSYGNGVNAGLTNGSTFTAGSGSQQNNGVAGNNIYSSVQFKVTKRVAPTLYTYDAAGTPAKISVYNGSWNNGITPTSVNTFTNGFYVQQSGAGQVITNFEWAVVAEL